MLKNIIFSLAVSLIILPSLCAMDPFVTPPRPTLKRPLTLTQTPLKPTTLFSDDHDIVESLCTLINSTQKDDEISVNCFVMTHKGFADSLIAAQKRGVIIKNIILDRTSIGYNNGLNIADMLHQAGLNVQIFNADYSQWRGKNKSVINHYKLFTRKRIKNGVPEYLVSQGSANFTNLAHDNKEHVDIEPNNQEMYNTCQEINKAVLEGCTSYADITNQTEVVRRKNIKQERNPILETPTKTTMVSTHDTDILRLIKDRFKKLHKGDSVLMNMYTLNEMDIAKLIVKKYEQGVLFDTVFDRASDNPVIDYLARKNVPVSIYDSVKLVLKNHCKSILFDYTSSGKIVTVTGSTNLTDLSSSKANLNQVTLSLEPEMFQAHKNMFYEVKKQSKPYPTWFANKPAPETEPDDSGSDSEDETWRLPSTSKRKKIK